MHIDFVLCNLDHFRRPRSTRIESKSVKLCNIKAVNERSSRHFRRHIVFMSKSDTSRQRNDNEMIEFTSQN